MSVVNDEEDIKQSDKKTHNLNYKKGYINELLKICLTAGGVSYNGLKVLDGDRETYTNSIRRLRNNGIVTIKRIGSEFVATLSDFGTTNEQYIENFIPYLGTYTRFIALKSKSLGWYKSKRHKTDAIKAFRYSEIVMLLKGTSIRTLTEDKPRLYAGEKVENNDAYFYSDSEVKELVGGTTLIDNENEDDKFLVTTRAQGFIVSQGGVYLVYHSGKEQRLAWAVAQEQQMKFRTANLIAKSFSTKLDFFEINDCIILADEDRPFVEMFLDEDLSPKRKTAFTKRVSIENGFANTYFLPYSKQGRFMTDFMSKKQWKEDMFNYFLEDDSSLKKAKVGSVADFHSGENPVLLFCIPNATRLYKFLLNAEISDKEYHIYCFDFQVDFLNEVVKGRAKIFSVSFDEFEDAVSKFQSAVTE